MLNRVNRLALVGLMTFSAIGLLYRATLYWRIPVSHGDAYGLGDVIDLAFWAIVVSLLCVVLLLSLLTLCVRQYRQALVRLMMGILVSAAYYLLHAQL